jgi:hypothetical protein
MSQDREDSEIGADCGGLRAAVHRYHECVTSADGLAAAGRVCEGYSGLVGGLLAAEHAQRHDGEWGSRLSERYRRALNRYTLTHGEKLIE